MGKKEQVLTPEGEVRRSGVLRQVIRRTLGVAYLVGVEEKEKAARAAATLPSEGSVGSGDCSGVER